MCVNVCADFLFIKKRKPFVLSVFEIASSRYFPFIKFCTKDLREKAKNNYF